MKKGIIAGLSSGIFWGLPFLVPGILDSFSALEIVIGRFFFFGITSLIFAQAAFKLFTSLSLKDKFLIVALSTTGFSLYSLCVFAAVQYTDGIISSLVVGTIPLIIVLVSNPKFNKLLFGGLILILLGLFFLLVFPVLSNMTILKSSNVTGLLLLLAAILMWVWFAIYSTKFLHRNPKINTRDYTSLIGITNLILVGPAIFFIDDFSVIIHSPKLPSYLLWTAILGIGASWIANWLWAFCSKNCPSSVSGILIVSETVFGLTYSFIFQQRLPYFHETIAIILLIIGVIFTVRSQRNLSPHG
jgi:drug/metabolite transporter (DMT)-like permease